MPRIDLVVESETSRSARARQLEGMFDVPPADKTKREWHIDAPFDSKPWNVGLIVGPSGSGKSSIARHLFGDEVEFQWDGKSTIDGFPPGLSMETISTACQAVGFNTIPAWLRPFHVLSNGEKFRATLARHLLSDANPIFVDEFTSVVDRGVAKIGAHAAQKYVRKNNKKFVAVTCHYDVEDWLQPDWVLDLGADSFCWRSVQRRPPINVEITPVHISAWRIFAPFHYMSADLHRAARCWCAFIDGAPAAFCATIPMPVSRGKHAGTAIAAVSRLVCLPDFQGLGVAMHLVDFVASAHAAVGRVTHTYPAHPSLIRTFDKSKNWALQKKPGGFSSRNAADYMGGRPCAVFRYAGPKADSVTAKKLFAAWT